MLGSVPDFNNGAVVAMVMLIPSVISIGVLKYLEKYNVRYNKISQEDLKKSPVRDVVFGILSVAICICVLSVFAVIFVIPLWRNGPMRFILHWKTYGMCCGIKSFRMCI